MGDDTMTDEAVWKKRFLLITLVRLVGTVIALLGLSIAFGDLVETGGSPILGFALVLVGLVDLTLAPRILSRRWRQP